MRGNLKVAGTWTEGEKESGVIVLLKFPHLTEVGKGGIYTRML